MEVLPILSKIFTNVLESGKQGILNNLGGGNGGSEGAHRSGATAHSVPTGIPSRTMRDLHNGQNPLQQGILGGSEQTE